MPFGQYLKIKRNCSHPIDYEEEARKLSQALLQRDYPERLVKQTKCRADRMQRKYLVREHRKESGRFVTFSFDYTSLAYSIRRLIYKYWHLVEPLVGNMKPRIGFRRTQSIMNKIVRADSLRRERIITNLKGPLLLSWSFGLSANNREG